MNTHLLTAARSCSSLVILILFFIQSAQAQCPVQAYADPLEIVCGDSIQLSGTGTPGFYVFENEFDDGSIGVGWEATSSADFTSPCGASPNATTYLWMGESATAPRNATTQEYDLSKGGSICFNMKYAAQGGGSPCEGPDLADEGVSIQYSVDGGTNWVTIQYYSPNGGQDTTRTNWT